MLSFTVTLYGTSENDERNAAQILWAALDEAHIKLKSPVGMLVLPLKDAFDDSTRHRPIDLSA